MGSEKPFNPVKLFSGIIFREENHLKAVIHDLQDRFSPVDLESGVFPFDLTDYYHREMGSPLFRMFIGFSRLVEPQQLPDIKKHCNRLEEKHSEQGRRRVNIDPGFLSEANVIIATTKNHYHRVPLRDGIYAHMEYTIRSKRVHVLEWTYPDFRKPEYMEFFNRMIPLHREQALTKSG